MSFIQENTLFIDLGISREYTIIQFSDVHAVTYQKETDNSEAIDQAIFQEKVWMKQRIDFAKKFKEKFEPESMLSSTECLDRLIDYSNKNHPDLVLLTGDIIDYYSLSNCDYLKRSIGRLESPYLFSCGNHESPSNRFQDICKGNCDFSCVDFGEFFVVSINNSNRKIKPSQIESFEILLKCKKPIILAMHIPMMTEYNLLEFMQLDSYYSMKYNDCDEISSQFIHLVSSCDEVKAVLCGHTHGSIVSLIAPNKPQYNCSSGLIGHVNKIIIK